MLLMEHQYTTTAIFPFATKGQVINTFSKFYDLYRMSWVSEHTSSILMWEVSQRLFLFIYFKNQFMQNEKHSVGGT